MHSLWETYLDGQEKTYLKLGGSVHCNLYWIAQIHKLIMNNLSIYRKPMICILYVTPNAPKSYKM